MIHELSFRTAGAGDAQLIARLHADSWRRHYRGAYADSYLDGNVVADREAVWGSRLAAPAGSETVLAEAGGRPAGFVHVVFDEDEKWGSLVDNLHVAAGDQRTGIGTRLMAHAARAIADRAAGRAMYLWVLEQNTAAQRFYHALGGTRVERSTVLAANGGDPARLNGSPHCLRIVWPDGSPLLATSGL